MIIKHKVNSQLETCSQCKERSDLNGKKSCYWCELESKTKGQDVYDLPEEMRSSVEEYKTSNGEYKI